jgi:hypothetical protein
MILDAASDVPLATKIFPLQDDVLCRSWAASLWSAVDVGPKERMPKCRQFRAPWDEQNTGLCICAAKQNGFRR